MPSSPQAEALLSTRRRVVGAGLAAAVGAGLGLHAAQPRAATAAHAQAKELLRKGGVVIAFRHALAPGTFDPPGFQLGDCGTQRNLSEEGRAQAHKIGAWFRERQLQPASVLSSPWCRCIDSAALAFRAPEVWPALGSPHGQPETTGEAHLHQLRAALAKATLRTGQFDVWLTHMFVLSDLSMQNTVSGEGLILRAAADGKAEVLARLAVQT